MRFSLSADDVAVAIGQVLKADATGLSIAYDPTASPALTVSSKTIDLTSPDFPGLDATRDRLHRERCGLLARERDVERLEQRDTWAASSRPTA